MNATSTALDVEAALRARGAIIKGRHWRFLCPAHDDRRPSADYSPEKRVWTCRSCHVGGGVRDLAQRLGLDPDPARPARRPAAPPAPASLPRDEWRDVWAAVVLEARRQDRRLAPYREVFRITDRLRRRHQLVADTRRVATALGDDPRAWELLALAARVATEAAAIEAALDRVMPHVA